MKVQSHCSNIWGILFLPQLGAQVSQQPFVVFYVLLIDVYIIKCCAFFLLLDFQKILQFDTFYYFDVYRYLTLKLKVKLKI